MINLDVSQLNKRENTVSNWYNSIKKTIFQLYLFYSSYQFAAFPSLSLCAQPLPVSIADILIRHRCRHYSSNMPFSNTLDALKELNLLILKFNTLKTALRAFFFITTYQNIFHFQCSHFQTDFYERLCLWTHSRSHSVYSSFNFREHGNLLFNLHILIQFNLFRQNDQLRYNIKNERIINEYLKRFNINLSY